MPKKQIPFVLRIAIRFFQKIIYLILQIPFIPFAIIGLIIIVYKEMILSKKLGVTYTAEKVLQMRWFMHMFNTRVDEASVKLYKALPIASHLGLLGFTGAALIANRICGYQYSLASIPEPGKATTINTANARTICFDQIMESNMDQVEQVVIMGAGYDLRVMKYAKGKNIKAFELDQEAIQNLKIEALSKAGIEHDWITYVPVDFNNESWSEKLLKSGFDTKKKTFYLWEGVTLYLEEEIVRQTLQTIVSISPKGSVISFDYYSKSIVAGEGPWFVKIGAKMYKKTGDAWLFGIDTSGDARGNVGTFLKECGFTLKDLTLLGKKTDKENPSVGIVEAVIE